MAQTQNMQDKSKEQKPATQEPLYVSIRVRPLLPHESAQSMAVEVRDRTITVTGPRTTFTAEYDTVFTPAATQEDVFSSISSKCAHAKSPIDRVRRGRVRWG